MLLYEMVSWLLLGIALAAMELLFTGNRSSRREIVVLGGLAAMTGGLIARLYALREPLGAYSLPALIAAGVAAIAALFLFELATKTPSGRST